ncbi:Heme exporter protein D (CcmD) [Methyloligella halotolerans]|uniref:Heme exporter protein D n=1 Tax=Methyloligella halotolerans TaxID=1177755 RepID=A0A1E2RVM4_9HYPH|nr:Heme exporter protein D (CcmD) [Methyloligella halotolerans]
MLHNALDLGPHAAFIWGAYAVTAICVIGLTVGVVANDRRQRRLLADLEARGITRRSAAKPTTADSSAEKPSTGTAEEPAKQTSPKPRSPAKASTTAEPKRAQSTTAKPKSQAKRAPSRRKSPAKPAQSARPASRRESK